MFSGVLDPTDHNVKQIKLIIMKKYYFALFCALMAATSAMAAPQSGDRIVAAQALAVEWDDVAFRPMVDEATNNVGLNAQLTPSEDENVLILSGLCGMFNIPVHVDYTTGKAWIETGTPLDAYTDQFDRNVVKTIYAMPEQWLMDGEADMNANLYGSILEDGSIAFDGGIVFLVSESTAEEATWMSTPLLRNMRLLVPNAIHQFTLVNEPLEQETIDPAESSSSTQLESGEARKNVLRAALVELVGGSGRAETQSGRKHRPKDPGDAGTCGFGDFGNLVVSSVGAPSGGGVIAAYSTNPYLNVDISRTAFGNTKDVLGGKKPPRRDPGGATTCGVIGDLVVASKGAPSGGGVIASRPVIPFNPGDMSQPFEFTDSAGRKPIKPREVKPCGGGLLDLVVANLRPNNGDAVRSPQNNRNENSNEALDLTKSGYHQRPVDPKNPKGCSEPAPWLTLLVESLLPNRFNPNPSVASSKPADEQFSVPVYVFQNPDDNSIVVYNLYGSGCVMNLNDCQVTPETITWGMTIPYLQDGDISCYFDSNALTLTDGTQFTVPAAIVKGDVSNDGKVNIADVTELIDLLLTAGNDGANQVVADVNQDGKIDITDTTILIDMLLHNAQ